MEIPMSLQEKLDAFKADFEGKKAPPHVVGIMHKATADLIASGQADRALKAGWRAPKFALPDAHGVVVRSTDLLAEGPLVLTFYRGLASHRMAAKCSCLKLVPARADIGWAGRWRRRAACESRNLATACMLSLLPAGVDG
jgi:hypothetical protein